MTAIRTSCTNSRAASRSRVRTTPITKIRCVNSCTSSVSAEASPWRIRSARLPSSPALVADGRPTTPYPRSGGLYPASLPPFSQHRRKCRHRRRFRDESCHVPYFPTTLPLNDTLVPNLEEKTMKFKTSMWIPIVALFTAGTMPISLAAQENAKKDPPHAYHHYKLVDIAPFGGPNSSYVIGPPVSRLLNNSGVAVGSADRPTPDPSCITFNFDCFLSYGFKWQDGVAHKLGALPGFNSSIALWVSDNGLVAGISENGIDPLTGGPALEAILWGEDGSINDLGTLGGNESGTNAVNNSGQVVGAALNTIPDPYLGFFFLPGATQVHAFRWTNSKGMQDLGTLGGTDSSAIFINERGQIAGW